LLTPEQSIDTSQIVRPAAERKGYAIVLAAGNGKRMQHFIHHYYGSSRPKQFIAFTGRRSMLQHTIHRIEKLISKEKILVVADPDHREEVRTQLCDRPPDTLIYQPINRETAPGVLLPLAHVYNRDPEATVSIFPSDHFILEEDRFMKYVRFAQSVIERLPDRMILLGVQPDGPEVDYGWIEPGERVTGFDGGSEAIEVKRVSRFLEKPDPTSALQFFRTGYLWNTLIMVTKCKTLWKLAKRYLPGVANRFDRIRRVIGTPAEQQFIAQEYQRMEPANISHTLLEKDASPLLVIHVKDVFWSDWGNGARVLQTLHKIGRLPRHLSEPPVPFEGKMVAT
jgi:mannose-1-phosphate guanylyltransferase